jgi:hypothetical protein
MKSFRQVVLLMACALFFVPALAAAQEAMLYELTENVKVVKDGEVYGRHAFSALMGWAKVGTPICPYELMFKNPRHFRCTVTAVGYDKVSLVTGTGPIEGTWATVIQFDNNVDGPEATVLTGTFKGDIDLTPALSNVAPLGYVSNGTFTIDGSDVQYSFSGKFRLPFAIENGRRGRIHDERDAYYLADDGKPFRVKNKERALGWPLVRFEVDFR